MCKYILGLIIALVSSNVVSRAATNPLFPRVKPTRFEMNINGTSDASKQVVIKTVDGKPAYELTVYAITLDNETARSIDVELNGIGGTATRFDTKYEDNLLNPDRWGHGVGEAFSPKELCSAKAENNQEVKQRVLILRKMRIEISVSELEMNKDCTGIIKAKVVVSVRSSSSNRSRPIS